MIDDQFEAIDRDVGGFGGIYYDASGRATIYLKPGVSSARAIEIIRTLWPKARGFDEPVVVPARYGYAELAEWRDSLATSVDRAGLVFDDIDERVNRLAIGVEFAEAGERIASDLASKGVPREALILEVTARARAISQMLTDTINPTSGGIYIRPDGLSGCTLGFNAKWNGVMHFVTASHCTSALGIPTYTYPDMGVVTGVLFCQRGCPDSLTYPGFQSKLGPEVNDPPYQNTPGYWGSLCASLELCRMADAALVRYDYRVPSGFDLALAGFGTLDYYGGYPMAGEIIGNNQLVGTLIGRTGASSGFQFGSITRTCIHLNTYSRPGGKSLKLVCQNEMDGEGIPGDSGEPVTFWDLSGGPFLLGIAANTRAGHTIYSPINNILTDFGPFYSWQSY